MAWQPLSKRWTEENDELLRCPLRVKGTALSLLVSRHYAERAYDLRIATENNTAIRQKLRRVEMAEYAKRPEPPWTFVHVRCWAKGSAYSFRVRAPEPAAVMHLYTAPGFFNEQSRSGVRSIVEFEPSNSHPECPRCGCRMSRRTEAMQIFKCIACGHELARE